MKKGFYQWCIENDKDHLLSEWDYEKNEDINIKEIGYGSQKKIWWIGSCNHQWMSTIKYSIYRTRHRGQVRKDKVYQQLTEELEITGVTWEDLLQDYISQFKNNCIPFPNLFEMLEELRNQNLNLGMITNGIGQFQIDNIKALGIEKYFQSILVSEWEGVKKTWPKYFYASFETT